jgi:hypothetical protein
MQDKRWRQRCVNSMSVAAAAPNPSPHFRPSVTYASANCNVSNMSIVFPQIFFCFFAALSVTLRRPFVPVEVKLCTKRDGSGGERLNKCGFSS